MQGAALDKSKVHAVVLAAGMSARFGAAKQVALVGGAPLVAHTVAHVLSAPFASVTVVLSPAVAAVWLPPSPARAVINAAPERGMLSSIKVGCDALRAAHLNADDGMAFILADQPLVTVADLQRLAVAFQKAGGKRIVSPVFDGRRGNPVLMPCRFIDDIMAASDRDQGASFILKANPELIDDIAMTHDGILFDVDTPSDFAKLTTRMRERGHNL